jgi:hypothetical protein
MILATATLHARRSVGRAEPENRVTNVLSRRIGAVTLAAAVVGGAACMDDDGPTSPATVEQVTGNYAATRFTATSVLGTQDVLKEGGSVTARFASNGTVTGHVTIPSQSVNEDFAGAWKIDGRAVEIEDVPTDTFLEDVKFDVVGNTLVADEIIDVVRVRLTLTKQSPQ